MSIYTLVFILFAIQSLLAHEYIQTKEDIANEVGSIKKIFVD